MRSEIQRVSVITRCSVNLSLSVRESDGTTYDVKGYGRIPVRPNQLRIVYTFDENSREWKVDRYTAVGPRVNTRSLGAWHSVELYRFSAPQWITDLSEEYKPTNVPHGYEKRTG